MYMRFRKQDEKPLFAKMGFLIFGRENASITCSTNQVIKFNIVNHLKNVYCYFEEDKKNIAHKIN